MGAGLLVALGLTLVSERAFEDEARTRASASVTTVVGVVSGVYAVLIAFVIINKWQSFNDAQSHVSDESAALASASFNAGALSEPGRTQIQ